MPIISKATLILLTFLAAFISITTAAARRPSVIATVHVAKETIAARDQIELGDIAEIRSTDRTAEERLRSIALGYAPNVGAIREITRDRIETAVSAAGFTAGDVQIDAPTVAVIRRAAQTVDSNLIRQAVEDATLKELKASGITAKLVRLDLPTELSLPTGKVEVRAATIGVRDLFSAFSVALEFRIEGRAVRRLNVIAQVEASAPVVVAAHDIAANTRVREDDVRLEIRKFERSTALYLRDSALVRGTSARRAFSRGDPITTDQIASEIVVKAGDSVLITGVIGNLRIVVAGEARAAGRVGDRIQVQNSQSKAMLQAIVVDEGLVRVRF